RLARGRGRLPLPGMPPGAGRVLALAALAVGAAAAMLAPQARFDADPMALRDPKSPSVVVHHWLTGDPALAPLRLGLIVADEAAAVAFLDDLRAEGYRRCRAERLTEENAAAETFPRLLAGALDAEMLSSDFVGPAVGADLRRGAVLAVLVALGLILVYVAWRFWPNWPVAIAVVLAAVHDVGLVLGFLDLTRAEFGIPVLAALLFVVGYSLNDSIIIADRIRENLGRVRDRNYADLVDLSVSQTIARTLVTSGTTLLPVLALLFFGGSVLRDFSITLLVGIGVGTYSSIFVLPPIIVGFRSLQRRRRKVRRHATA
ncbi:MAG: protein translocase subunit SecF, partial [Trueperaceae bacterium]|nr:protein translocase subunit SecF [Trueperaceae bacterium]